MSAYAFRPPLAAYNSVDRGAAARTGPGCGVFQRATNGQCAAAPAARQRLHSRAMKLAPMPCAPGSWSRAASPRRRNRNRRNRSELVVATISGRPGRMSRAPGRLRVARQSHTINRSVLLRPDNAGFRLGRTLLIWLLRCRLPGSAVAIAVSRDRPQCRSVALGAIAWRSAHRCIVYHDVAGGDVIRSELEWMPAHGRPFPLRWTAMPGCCDAQ